MKKNLRFICVQPAIDYYTWQVEVMINNFMEKGINPNFIDVVCGIKNDHVPERWQKLANRYNTVRFFFYNDTRQSPGYISSLRPHVLKKHFQAIRELSDEAIFYPDNDIMFTDRINFDQFLQDDTWYGSDCRWYISHDYIISKGEDILDAMCNIVKIDKALVKENELNSIGAQYLMKNLTAEFWENVERDCEKLFVDITAMNNIKKQADPKYHELQIWCADMWAVLWNGWKLGNKTECHKDLSFSWATSSAKEWTDHKIYHNAGVTGTASGQFYKADYMQKLPYNEPLEIKPDYCSYHYWQWVQKVAQISCLV
jgi:hypothetical protein